MQEKLAASPTPDNKEPDFFDYLEIILKRKKMILKVTLLSFVLMLAISLFSKKIYESTTRILPPQQDQGLMGMMMGSIAGGGGGALAGLAGGMLGAITPADQYAAILKSERIKDVIIDRFKLMEEFNAKYRLSAYKAMDKVYTIKAGKKDGIITITTEAETAQTAADIANAYIDELSKLVAEMSMSGASLNRSFLESRLVRAKADLARAEEALKAFQSKNKALDVPEQAKATIAGVAQLKAQLAVQEAQLSALRSQFTDSTQEVKSLKATIVNLKSQLAQLEGNGTGAIPSFASVPQLGQEQVRLLREFKTQEMIVELLTKQYELEKFTEAKKTAPIQVIQKATPADHEIRRGFRKRYVILLTFLAGAGAVCWVLFQDYKSRMPADQKERWDILMALLKGNYGKGSSDQA